MTLISEYVRTNWQRRNIRHYKSKGHVYTGIGEEFLVKATDLSKGSHVEVLTKCYYCEDIVEKTYKTYLMQTEDGTGINSCRKCKNNKLERNFKEKHGVNNPMYLESVKKKQRETMMKNHGVEFPLQSKEILSKTKETNKERYGGTSPMHNDKVKEKISNTNIRRYGVSYYSQTEEFKEKFKKASLKKYGYENISQSPEIKRKKAETMYKNGTTPSSSQQNHIHKLVGGKLNYPVSKSSLDIAFPDEMIYLEYDGGGHNLSVKLGQQSQKEFDKQDRKRTFFLFDKGWKEIRLVSDEDKLPSDEEIVKTVNKAKQLLNNERVKSIIINWDNNTVLFGFKRKASLERFLSDDFAFSKKEVS